MLRGAGGRPSRPRRAARQRRRFVRERLLDDGPADAGVHRERRRIPTSGSSICPDTRAETTRRQPGQTPVPARRLRRGAAPLRRRRRHDHLDADDWRAAGRGVAIEPLERGDPDAGSGSSTPRHGPTADSSAPPDCAQSERRRPASGPPSGCHLPMRSLPTPGARGSSVRPLAARRGRRRPDAALLLAAIRGAIPSEDPRSVATLHAIEQELTEDGYAYRYRHDERPLGEAEGAFLLCGFWMALAWHQKGDMVPPHAGSSATAPPADPRGCSRRSSTCASARCAATFPRLSCTRCCSSARASTTQASRGAEAAASAGALQRWLPA